jgi:hypothetical protein
MQQDKSPCWGSEPDTRFGREAAALVQSGPPGSAYAVPVTRGQSFFTAALLAFGLLGISCGGGRHTAGAKLPSHVKSRLTTRTSVHSCRSGTQGYKEPDGYFCIRYDIKTYKVKRQH